MKAILLVLVCAFFGAPAMAEHQLEVEGESSFIVLQSGQVAVEITGPAADMLYTHMTDADAHVIKSDDGKTVSYQRVGKNVTCDKVVAKKRITTTCTLSDIQKDGSSAGAAG